MYIISPLTSQLRTNSQKIAIKYVGPVVIYKIVDPQLFINDVRWKNIKRSLST